jgi:hypothetical protein
MIWLLPLQALRPEEESAVIRPARAAGVVIGGASDAVDICSVPGIIYNWSVPGAISDRCRVVVGLWIVGVGIGRIVPAGVVIARVSPVVSASRREPVVVVALVIITTVVAVGTAIMSAIVAAMLAIHLSGFRRAGVLLCVYGLSVINIHALIHRVLIAGLVCSTKTNQSAKRHEVQHQFNRVNLNSSKPNVPSP